MLNVSENHLFGLYFQTILLGFFFSTMSTLYHFPYFSNCTFPHVIALFCAHPLSFTPSYLSLFNNSPPPSPNSISSFVTTASRSLSLCFFKFSFPLLAFFLFPYFFLLPLSLYLGHLNFFFLTLFLLFPPLVSISLPLSFASFSFV